MLFFIAARLDPNLVKILLSEKIAILRIGTAGCVTIMIMDMITATITLLSQEISCTELEKSKSFNFNDR
jgi:hypothetical protein